MQKWMYDINWSSQSPVKGIQHFIQLDIFLNKKMDIITIQILDITMI